MEFPVLCHLVARNLHKVAAPYFFIIMYIVQLYKEDWTISYMLGCQAVALPSTEQIVDGCQGLKETLTDITAVTQSAAMQHG